MIEIQHLTFGYRKGLALFNNLDATFSPGNIYGLLGRNGAGKTTLLKNITGLLFPHKGTVKLNGYPSQDRHPSMLEELFIVPENFYLPPIKIKDYIKINAPFYPNFNQDECNTYLEEFELNPDLKLSQISFGQQKKAFLALALATNTSYLILDEPTNGLDIPSKTQFRKILTMAINENKCFIISTHQVRDLESIIDPIIILEKGKVVFDRTLDKISEKLVFTRQNNIENDNNVLYSEEQVGGYAVIKKNTGEVETKINVEMLFNGVLKNQEGINQQF